MSRGSSSVGRASAFQAECRGSESRLPLSIYFGYVAAWPSGKAEACKAFIPQFESGCRLLFKFCKMLTSCNLIKIKIHAYDWAQNPIKGVNFQYVGWLIKNMFAHLC